MAVPTAGDLLRLAASNPEDPHDRIERMFGWHIDRTMSVVKGLLSLALSVALTVAITFARGEVELEGRSALVFAVVASALALVAAVTGLWIFQRLRSIERAYAAALKLYEDLRPMALFLAPYL